MTSLRHYLFLMFSLAAVGTVGSVSSSPSSLNFQQQSGEGVVVEIKKTSSENFSFQRSREEQRKFNRLMRKLTLEEKQLLPELMKKAEEWEIVRRSSYDLIKTKEFLWDIKKTKQEIEKREQVYRDLLRLGTKDIKHYPWRAPR